MRTSNTNADARVRLQMVEVLGAYSNRERSTSALNDLVARAKSERPRASRPPVAAPRRAKMLPEDVQAAVMEACRAGHTMNGLARDFGVHRATVKAILKRRKEQVRSRGLSAEQVEEAKSLYENERLSLARIGERYGVNANTVRTGLLNAGVAMRDTHGRVRAA